LSIVKTLFKERTFAVGFGIVVCLFFLGLAAPLVSPYPAQGMGETVPSPCSSPAGVCAPTLSHPFGTEVGGRDIMSRIFFGLRTSILVSLLVVSISFVIGLFIGVSAGYFGGWVDELLMRITDVFLSFPHIILALIIVATLGPGLKDVVIALGVTWWPYFARLSRVQALSVKFRPYVQLSKYYGVPSFKVMLGHLIPSSLSPLVIQATLDLGSVVLAEAGLSFLGLGVRPPTADLGRMIFESIDYVTTAWWYPLFPGIFLALLVIGFNLMGDSLRERFEPSLRRSF
jgi:ABC-type dipeptide/oligopeptide/nickel transport systems, permease components